MDKQLTSLPLFLIITFLTTIAISTSLVSANNNPTVVQVPATLFPKHYVPSADVYAPSVSFHTKPNYEGDELFFDGTWLSLHRTFTFQSHRFTGRINWTIYPTSNYTGQPTCLISDPEEPVTYNDELQIKVGSIRRGCWCNYSIKVTPRPKYPNQGNTVAGVHLHSAHKAQGKSLFTDALETRLPGPFSMKSFALVGRWKKWTVFSNKDLTGDSYCLEVKNTGREDWAQYTNIRENFNVRSIREGCVVERTFESLEGEMDTGDQAGGSVKISINMNIGIIGFIAFVRYVWIW